MPDQDNNSKKRHYADVSNFIMGIITAISITVAVVLSVGNIKESQAVKKLEKTTETLSTRQDEYEHRQTLVEANYVSLGEKIDRLIIVVEKHTGTR